MSARNPRRARTGWWRAASRRRRQDGFTLIEVLVAMIILAVGLLALEALAIGASQQVVRGSLQTEYTLMATERVERALADIRATGQTLSGQEDVDGTLIQTVVEQQQAGGRALWTVEVTVTPKAHRVHVPPITVTGSEFL